VRFNTISLAAHWDHAFGPACTWPPAAHAPDDTFRVYFRQRGSVLLSTDNCQLATVSRPRSPVVRSARHCPLSTIHFPLSADNRQLATVNRPPSPPYEYVKIHHPLGNTLYTTCCSIYPIREGDVSKNVWFCVRAKGGLHAGEKPSGESRKIHGSGKERLCSEGHIRRKCCAA
jgi:hypothetical protein